MAEEIQVCPHCGNYVQATRVKSYSNKVTRQGAKSAVHMATSAGGMATGAAVGSAILPGIGTVVGGALGFLGSAMFNQAVNSGIDSVADEFTDFNLEFKCPKCGYSWKDGENSTVNEEELLEVTIDHGVTSNNLKGMMLHLKFNVYDQKNKECSVAVWVHDANDEQLFDQNGRLADDDGHIFAVDTFTPPYEATTYNDYQFFFPYAELHLQGEQEFKLLIAVFDSSQNVVVADKQDLNWSGDNKYIDNWHEFNIVRDGQKGMLIHTKFEVEDMKGEKGAVLINFKDAETYEDCVDEDGESIYYVEHFTPPYESSVYNDFEIFIPYSLLSNVEKSFYYQVEVYHYEDKRVILRGEPSDDIEWT